MSEEKNLTTAQNNKPVKAAENKPAVQKKSFGASLARIGRSIAKWGRDLKGEVRKIVWPGGKQTRNNSIVVVTVIAIFTVIVWLMDLIFENVILKGLLALVTGF